MKLMIQKHFITSRANDLFLSLVTFKILSSHNPKSGIKFTLSLRVLFFKYVKNTQIREFAIQSIFFKILNELVRNVNYNSPHDAFESINKRKQFNLCFFHSIKFQLFTNTVKIQLIEPSWCCFSSDLNDSNRDNVLCKYLCSLRARRGVKIKCTYNPFLWYEIAPSCLPTIFSSAHLKHKKMYICEQRSHISQHFVRWWFTTDKP